MGITFAGSALRKSIVGALAAAAIAAPAAQADSLDPWAYNVVLRSSSASAPLKGEHSYGQNRVGTRVGIDPWAFNAVRLVTEHTRGQYRPLRSAAGSPAPTRFVESGGFQWTDAGIGAGIAVGLVLIAAGATFGFRRAQSREASA